jgi:stage V sporulation protein AE
VNKKNNSVKNTFENQFEVSFTEFFNAFWVGGAICVIGQLLIDLTKLTPARIMVIYVTAGVILGAMGWYDPIVNYAGCGATVQL